MTHGDDGATGGEGHGRGQGCTQAVRAIVTRSLEQQLVVKNSGALLAYVVTADDRRRGARR